MTWIDTDTAGDDLMLRCASGRRSVCLTDEMGSSPIRSAMLRRTKTRPLHRNCGQFFMLPVAQMGERQIVDLGQSRVQTPSGNPYAYTVLREAA